MTKIEWTDATWNPIVGCSIVSPGCTNCYAMKMAHRIGPNFPHYKGLTKLTKGGPVWTGKVALAPEETLLAPLRWKKPRMVFVNSMSDLFHEDVPDDWIDRIFAVMALTPQHTYQVLTKRAERMQRYFDGCDLQKDLMDWSRPWHGVTHWHRRDGVAAVFEALIAKGIKYQPPRTLPLPNVWLGVSAERQPEFDERWPHLQSTPAAVRFISYEPGLGPLDATSALNYCDEDGPIEGMRKRGGLDWIIAGGESGPGARPSHPDWFRSLRDQCQAAGVPFFFKQWGAWRPATDEELPRRFGDACAPFRCMCSNGFVGELAIGSAFLHKPKRWPQCFPNGANGDASCNAENIRHVGNAKAGALLDGREWRDFPA